METPAKWSYYNNKHVQYKKVTQLLEVLFTMDNMMTYP